MIAEPLGVELRIQLTKVFVIVVAEEAANPSFRGQSFSFVVGIDLRREAPGSNEHAEGGFEGLKIKAFAWLKLDRSYPEISKDRDGSSKDAISSPAARDP